MTEPTNERAQPRNDDESGGLVPVEVYDPNPVVGLGGSAGSLAALQAFFSAMPPDSGLAFVVVMHLAPDHESSLPELLQRATAMPVRQVTRSLHIDPDTVYVIPPRFGLTVADGKIALEEMPLERGRHLVIDLFFRTLAETHGPHAAAVVLSGADADGATGVKRVKERGGLVIAQDPGEAQHAGMPRASIDTGMVDWVLPVREIPHRLLAYFSLEDKLELPPGEAPRPDGSARAPLSADEAALRDVLTFLRARTGRDFSSYKRATILRRIGRRMQVNGVQHLPAYLNCLRTRPQEAGALLQDLLITVTNFFRDPECFDALDRQLPAILAGKGPGDVVRVWVAACATGEEAYSIAMLLAEHARAMDAPPAIQIFATDLDDHAVRTAREGFYPDAVEADVSAERLKRFFVKEHRGYRVRRELRETVLFALHDLLKDPPFSRLDLVSCRNLLIYLNRDAQARVFDTFHFALLPGARLFLGSSESVEDGSALYNVVDKKHRIFRQRPTPRAGLPVPSGPGALALSLAAVPGADMRPAIAGHALLAPAAPAGGPPEPRSTSWGELHLRLLEQLAPPSILVDGGYDIVHLSPSAGRFLQFAGGEPSRNLLRSVDPALRIELRAALYEAAQTQSVAEVPGVRVEIGGQQTALDIRVAPAKDVGAGMYLVVLQAAAGTPPDPGAPAKPTRIGEDAVARHLDRELEDLKAHLRETVEQYEASTEELKASNEELQAMNEELRSATEELETSREELQSINEELTTVNHELKSKVDELGHANSDLQNLMDATAIGTVFLDRDLRITRYTPSAVAMFNLIPTDLGRPLADLKTHLHYPQLGADAARVLERLVPVEREVAQSDGSWYLARLLPYRTEEDRIAGVVLSLIDITERKQAAENLVRALAENEKARADLQAADAAKDRFLAVLSHELRNPLASIDSAAALITAEGTRPEDAREAAAVVQRQARGMKVMLDDLMDVSRLKLGRLEIKRERVRLSAIVANAIEITRPMLQEAGHALKVELPPGDVELEGDELRLGQVVSNLLANAIRYTPRAGEITIAARLADGKLEILVKDNGVGMEPARVEGLFEMFAQGERDGAPAPGLGIGLALVRALVQLHGGSVTARSDGPGRGSEFRVELPGAVAAAAPPASSASAAKGPAGRTRGLVVVADDNRDAGWGMANLLELNGFTALHVESGEEAMEAIAQRRPVAAVIDIGLPGIDGHEVARRLRATEAGRRLVLVAASGYGQQSDQRAALQAGFDVHLTKPVDARKLAALLGELLAAK